LSGQIIYRQLPDYGVFGLDNLWARLRGGECTWPPYAINAWGGITTIDTTLLVPFLVFGHDANLPSLRLTQAVRDASLETSNPTINDHAFSHHIYTYLFLPYLKQLIIRT
jgi:hypothetical protein